jgi:hypothetical protein
VTTAVRVAIVLITVGRAVSVTVCTTGTVTETVGPATVFVTVFVFPDDAPAEVPTIRATTATAVRSTHVARHQGR